MLISSVSTKGILEYRIMNKKWYHWFTDLWVAAEDKNNTGSNNNTASNN